MARLRNPPARPHPVDDIAGAVQAIDQAMEALRLARARLLSNGSPDRRAELV